jgi:hypothetical protein
VGKLVLGCDQERLLRKNLSASFDVVRLLLRFFDKRAVKRSGFDGYFEVILLDKGCQLLPYARGIA